MFFYDVLSYIDIFFFLIVALFILFNFVKLAKVLKVFGVFVTIVFIIAASSFIVATIGRSNIAIFHPLLFIQLAWLSVYYYKLSGNSTLRYAIAILAGIATLYFISYYVIHWPEVIEQLGGKLYFVSNIIFIVYAVSYYFYNLFAKSRPQYPYINAGVIIYFSGSSVIFLFGDYLKVIPLDKQIFLWIFNVVLHITFLILIFVEIWKQVYPNKKILSR